MSYVGPVFFFLKLSAFQIKNYSDNDPTISINSLPKLEEKCRMQNYIICVHFKSLAPLIFGNSFFCAIFLETIQKIVFPLIFGFR